MRKRTVEDYYKLALDLDINYISAFLPTDTTEPAMWECKRCGRIIRRSFNNMRHYPNVCMCRTGKTLTRSDYEQLASDLGLTLISDGLPMNNKTKIWWQNGDGLLFEASYVDLTHRVTHKLKEFIGLT